MDHVAHTLLGAGRRDPSPRRRAALASAVGLATAAGLARVVPWQETVLVGWDLAALTLLASIWLSIGPLDPTATSRLATREDSGRSTTWLVLLAASVLTLPAVILGLIEAQSTAGAVAVTLTVASVLAVVLSWALVHTVFTLRYAHLYYRPTSGGIDFTSERHPDYVDFAYLSFTVGMTFQVSDTNITDHTIRRTVLRHALLSFLFGTVIVATTINIIAGLLR